MEQPAFWIGSNTPLEFLAIALLFPPDGRAKQLVFILPVQIDRPLAHPCLASHIINRGLAISPPHQQRGSDIQQPLLPQLPLVKPRPSFRRLTRLRIIAHFSMGRTLNACHISPCSTHSL